LQNRFSLEDQAAWNRACGRAGKRSGAAAGKCRVPIDRQNET
jgi:hypothetical protein